MLFAGMPSPSQEPRWSEMLAGLERAGLCTRAKRHGIESLGTEYCLELFTRRRYRQVVYHAKISLSPAGDASAKCYFGAYPVG